MYCGSITEGNINSQYKSILIVSLVKKKIATCLVTY